MERRLPGGCRAGFPAIVWDPRSAKAPVLKIREVNSQAPTHAALPPATLTPNPAASFCSSRFRSSDAPHKGPDRSPLVNALVRSLAVTTSPDKVPASAAPAVRGARPVLAGVCSHHGTQDTPGARWAVILGQEKTCGRDRSVVSRFPVKAKVVPWTHGQRGKTVLPHFPSLEKTICLLSPEGRS